MSSRHGLNLLLSQTDLQFLVWESVNGDLMTRVAVPPEFGWWPRFLVLSGYSARLWTGKFDSDGTAGWLLGRTVQLDKVLSLNSEEGFTPLMVWPFVVDKIEPNCCTMHKMTAWLDELA
ncbi:hypothetical protein U9M48_025023 [Paspalum notatum var. saurae]|uniref:Uncharacterized protein n=1 Tax=Paspalum notatum var. saurae TaxID=547442 RepID=A0AAQ3TNG9_PASNO